ncbi:MAG TPA: hypothetical protein VNM14_07645 [Planctomycetota bacterium]|jgi:hypothetical protein|nr:hypothetical protein [Planctomycetota bacterium]
MASGVPKGWEKDSDKLFIHETGIRIQRMTYKGKDGWFLVPVDLDAAVVEFEPTNEGRDKAFEAFAKGALVVKPKKTKATTKKAAAAKPAPKEEEGEEKDDDDDDDDDGEKPEADEGDEG